MDKDQKIRLLDESNYFLWAYDVRCALGAKDCLDALEDDKSKNNIKALSIIGLAVSDHFKPTIMLCKTAKESWEKLEKLHQSQSIAQALMLKQDLAHIKLHNETISQYFARGRILAARLGAAGETVSDAQLVMYLLGGLPDEYEAATSYFELAQTHNKQLDLDEVQKTLMSREQKLERKEVVMAMAAVSIKRQAKASLYCKYCEKKGHDEDHCFKKKRESGKTAQAFSMFAKAI